MDNTKSNVIERQEIEQSIQMCDDDIQDVKDKIYNLQMQMKSLKSKKTSYIRRLKKLNTDLFISDLVQKAKRGEPIYYTLKDTEDYQDLEKSINDLNGVLHFGIWDSYIFITISQNTDLTSIHSIIKNCNFNILEETPKTFLNKDNEYYFKLQYKYKDKILDIPTKYKYYDIRSIVETKLKEVN